MGNNNIAKKILILVATYNEAANIERLLGEALSLGDNFDVLVIDDNSPDGTGLMAKNLYRGNKRVKVVIRENEIGRGSASIVGYKYFTESDYGYLCELDADFQEDPKDIFKLISEAEKTNCDIVIGSRYVEGGGFESYKKELSLFAKFSMSFLFKTQIKDITNWFHLIRRGVFNKVPYLMLKSRGFFLATELHLLAEDAGLHLKEIPIFFPPRSKGKTKINFKVVAEFAKDAILFKFRRRIDE